MRKNDRNEPEFGYLVRNFLSWERGRSPYINILNCFRDIWPGTHRGMIDPVS